MELTWEEVEVAALIRQEWRRSVAKYYVHVDVGWIKLSQVKAYNRRKSKIAIYRSPMKILASNFTDRLTTGAILDKMQN